MSVGFSTADKQNLIGQKRYSGHELKAVAEKPGRDQGSFKSKTPGCVDTAE